jgi:tol-pal system protein YbgF
MTKRRLAGLVAAIAVVGGCATRADLARLKRDQQEMRAQVADMQVSVDSINRRLDTVRSSVGESGSRDSAAVKAMERRVADLEARLAQAATPTETPLPGEIEARPTPSVPGTEAAPLAMRREAGRTGTVSENYRKGLQLYREGQPDQAVLQFRDFVRANPKSDLADSAQYWIGEAYYSKADYNRSIMELNEVLLKYPQGDQVPGALLALATAFANSGDKIDARLILQKLVSDHPKSEEAEIGRRQLQMLNE